MSADISTPATPDQRTDLDARRSYPVPARFAEGEWGLMAVPAVICVVLLLVAMVQ